MHLAEAGFPYSSRRQRSDGFGSRKEGLKTVIVTESSFISDCTRQPVRHRGGAPLVVGVSTPRNDWVKIGLPLRFILQMPNRDRLHRPSPREPRTW